MSGRFQLDPSARAPERPPVAPPSARPPPKAPPAPPPTPAPSAPAPAKGGLSRRTIIIGAIVVVALLVVGGVGVYVATGLGYPGKYVLSSSEQPAGMSNAQLDQSDMDDYGITSNPGAVDLDKSSISDKLASANAQRPAKANAQVLEDSGGSRVEIFALKYADEKTAQSESKKLRAVCSFAQGAVLGDGDVRVVILPDRGASRAQVDQVVTALHQKTSALSVVC